MSLGVPLARVVVEAAAEQIRDVLHAAAAADVLEVDGRDAVSTADIKAIAKPALRHRIVTNFTAQAEGITSDVLIDRLVDEVDPGRAVGAGLPGVKGEA